MSFFNFNFMENFIAYNPTKLHFGKNVTTDLGKASLEYGKRVLLIYGKGSVVRNGYYKLIISELEKIGASVFEYSGVQPNPLSTHADEAAELARKHQIEVIVALGGGSVIDTAKVVSLCVREKHTAWDVMTYKVEPQTSIPLIVVLTLAATGTEMNHFSVLQNPKTKEKNGYRNTLTYPKHAFLDPNFTLTVPADYTAYGITDLIAHALEAYFGKGDAPLSDRFVAAIIRESMDYAESLLADLQNYELRARMMWSATTALNGLTAYGKVSGDWGVHALGHILSLLYDTPHGASLSIAYPAWLRYHKHILAGRLKQLAIYLFDNEDIDSMINRLESFFTSINSPVRLHEIGIKNSQKAEILALMNKNKASGYFHELDDAAREKILNFMF